jgi:hypothetical protein
VVCQGNETLEAADHETKQVVATDTARQRTDGSLLTQSTQLAHNRQYGRLDLT